MCACVFCKDHHVQCEKEETIRRNVEKRRRQNKAESRERGPTARRGGGAGGRGGDGGAEATQRFPSPVPSTPLLLCVCVFRPFVVQASLCRARREGERGRHASLHGPPSERKMEEEDRSVLNTFVVVSLPLFIGSSRPSFRFVSFRWFFSWTVPHIIIIIIHSHPPVPRSPRIAPSRPTPPLLPLSLCNTITPPAG